MVQIDNKQRFKKTINESLKMVVKDNPYPEGLGLKFEQNRWVSTDIEIEKAHNLRTKSCYNLEHLQIAIVERRYFFSHKKTRLNS